MLFAGKATAIRKHVPTAEIQYVHLDPGGEPDARDDLRLPILQALDRVLDRIQARNRMVSVPVGLARVEVWDFPIGVCREALLNAIAHRDYSIQASIMIRHRDETLEVLSPGPFPHGISPENLLHAVPVHRNPTLAAAFKELGYVERLGVGVDRMYRLMLQSGKEPPTFEAHPNYVRVALRAGDTDEAFVRLIHEEHRAGRALDLDQLILLGHIRRHRLLRRDRAAALIQRSPDDTSAVLVRMTDAGLIERVAGGRHHAYRLSARVYEALGQRADYTRDRGIARRRQEELVVEHVREFGSITNAECRTLCGISAEAARYLLGQLTRRSILRRVGKGPATHYVADRHFPEEGLES